MENRDPLDDSIDMWSELAKTGLTKRKAAARAYVTYLAELRDRLPSLDTTARQQLLGTYSERQAL